VRPGRDVAEDGLGPDVARWWIFFSGHAHFAMAKGAHVLGPGASAVVRVAAANGVLRLDALRRVVAGEPGGVPFALVLTAGTTDFGAIDPLETVSAYARE
jgi:L-2,4-diaminobutyrate decarboxylase